MCVQWEQFLYSDTRLFICGLFNKAVSSRLYTVELESDYSKIS